MKPVLLVGHDPNETFGVAPKALANAGVEVLEHRAGKDDRLPNLEDVGAVVVFGGEMNVDMTDRHPFLETERHYVRGAIDLGIPYLGICLGAQMLARAMDHRVFPAGTREFGFNTLHLTDPARDDRLMAAFRDGDLVFHWHQDTFELPEGATLLGTGDDVYLQAFRVGDHAWGVQFHFEVDRAELDLWLKVAGEDVVRAWGKTTQQVSAEADLHMATQERRARDLFHRFSEVVRPR